MRAGLLPQPPSAAFCPLHRSGSCRSCPHQDLPLADQLARKQAHVASVLIDNFRVHIVFRNMHTGIFITANSNTGSHQLRQTINIMSFDS